MRAAGPAPVRLAGRSTRRLLQLHRRLVQPSQAPLRPGLPLAHPLRAGHANGTATSQALNCPRDRGNFSLLAAYGIFRSRSRLGSLGRRLFGLRPCAATASPASVSKMSGVSAWIAAATLA